MNKQQSYTTPLVIAIAVFSVSIIFLWIAHADEINNTVAWIGASYATICLGFLIFQIVAFVRAHVVYDEDIEAPKLKVFEIEDEESRKLKKYFS